MGKSSLKSLIRHEVRLDILCCVDAEPLSIPEVSARINQRMAVVAYHFHRLESGNLVEKQGSTEVAQYTATLDEHPGWVAGAVSDHRCVG